MSTTPTILYYCICGRSFATYDLVRRHWCSHMMTGEPRVLTEPPVEPAPAHIKEGRLFVPNPARK